MAADLYAVTVVATTVQDLIELAQRTKNKTDALIILRGALFIIGFLNETTGVDLTYLLYKDVEMPKDPILPEPHFAPLDTEGRD